MWKALASGTVASFQPARRRLEAEVDVFEVEEEPFVEAAHRLERLLADQHAGGGVEAAGPAQLVHERLLFPAVAQLLHRFAEEAGGGRPVELRLAVGVEEQRAGERQAGPAVERGGQLFERAGGRPGVGIEQQHVFAAGEGDRPVVGRPEAEIAAQLEQQDVAMACSICSRESSVEPLSATITSPASGPIRATRSSV